MRRAKAESREVERQKSKHIQPKTPTNVVSKRQSTLSFTTVTNQTVIEPEVALEAEDWLDEDDEVDMIETRDLSEDLDITQQFEAEDNEILAKIVQNDLETDSGYLDSGQEELLLDALLGQEKIEGQPQMTYRDALDAVNTQLRNCKVVLPSSVQDDLYLLRQYIQNILIRGAGR